jgi:hypothetical protein
MRGEIAVNADSVMTRSDRSGNRPPDGEFQMKTKTLQQTVTFKASPRHEGCLLFRRCQGISRHPANRPKMTRVTHSGQQVGAPEHRGPVPSLPQDQGSPEARPSD